MAQLTYLGAVNKVLVNLRESAVTDLSATFSILAGEFINQAKEKVEAAWRWKGLTTTLSFTTVTSQIGYQLTAAATTPAVTSSSGIYPLDNRAQILQDENGNWQVFDTTTSSTGGLIQLSRATRETEFKRNLYLANQAPIQPSGFSFSTEGGIPLFYLVGAPTGSRAIQIRAKCPQDQFSVGTEVFMTPWRPIVSFATFLAMEERGEELSEKSSLYLDRHNQELERAIENDTDGEDGYMQLRNDEAH